MKAFFYTIIGYFGIEILSSNNALLIRIPEGSVGWYVLLFVHFFFLFYGLYSVYNIIKRIIRCYQLKNFRKIKKRQINASTKQYQSRSN